MLESEVGGHGCRSESEVEVPFQYLIQVTHVFRDSTSSLIIGLPSYDCSKPLSQQHKNPAAFISPICQFSRIGLTVSRLKPSV